VTPDTLTLEAEVAADLAGGLEQWKLDDSPVRRQAALVILGRVANEAADLGKLLDDAAALVARTLDLAWFGVAQNADDGRPLQLRMGNVEAGEHASIREHSLAREPSQSAAAYALKAGRPVIVADLKSEQRFQDAVLNRSGAVSGILCSLAHADRQFGVLGAFSSHPRNFGKEDVLFVQMAAQLLGLSLARHQSELALAEQSKFLSAAMDTMEGLVLVLSPEGRILRFNQACSTVTGFHANEVKDRHVWSAFLLPDEVGQFRTTIDKLRAGDAVRKLETFLLTKHGERRRIAWSFTAVRAANGSVQSVVGSGIDITRQCEAMQSLERAEAEAEQARRALNDLRVQLDNGDLVRLGKHLLPIDGGNVLPPDIAEDRRGEQRRSYPYIQVLAPVINHRLPELHHFYDVRCRDISPRGFSFLLPEPPAYEQYVVAFGAFPTQIFLVVKVMHYSPYRFEDRDMFLVGCRYVARADYDRDGPRDELAPVADS
jgi:PAS domain S-box-containing protein